MRWHVSRFTSFYTFSVFLNGLYNKNRSVVYLTMDFFYTVGYAFFGMFQLGFVLKRKEFIHVFNSTFQMDHHLQDMYAFEKNQH
ncbi:unnamed protein product [Allacma fusca]|uniref:Uncharacterized protein n=1 Tax=Allacma fusca TaxID=39272 RepID=A0A8J2M046_9HEXA|nr:unnamed protein product [Allacma fusca]